MAVDSISFFFGEGELVELNLEKEDDSEKEKEEKKESENEEFFTSHINEFLVTFSKINSMKSHYNDVLYHYENVSKSVPTPPPDNTL